MSSSLAYIRTLNCLVCGASNPDPDHIRTRGAGGGDEIENIWPLCRTHHTERHKIGLSTFVEKYGLGAILILKGWEPIAGKWKRTK